MHFSATQKIKYLWKYEGICNSTIWWELCTLFHKLQYCEAFFCKTLWICAHKSTVKTYVHISFLVIVGVETTFDVLGCQKLVEVFQSNIIVCLKLLYVTIKYITNITSEQVSKRPNFPFGLKYAKVGNTVRQRPKIETKVPLRLPLSSRSSTVAECPNRAARWRGPTPPRDGRLTSAPWSSKSRTKWVWPWRDAKCKGPTPPRYNEGERKKRKKE